jgi:hypothetical protein
VVTDDRGTGIPVEYLLVTGICYDI